MGKVIKVIKFINSTLSKSTSDNDIPFDSDYRILLRCLESFSDTG